MSAPSGVMPSLVEGFAGFRHTVGSALHVLSRLGVPASRITLRMAGPGYPSRRVVRQYPAAGAPLDGGTAVVLEIAGLGVFQALPFGMRDHGTEHDLGTQQIVETFDDPLQKAAHWIREGARLFELTPENTADCGRWIRLFGLEPDDWPVDTWYRLALLLPSLHELAGTEHGIRLIFQVLLQLPLERVGSFPSLRRMPEDQWSRLGGRASRLGVDCIVGNRLDDLAGVLITIGPVPLQVYDDFRQAENRRLLSRVLDLSVSRHRQCRVTWSVLDAARAPRLGVEARNARLGINSHLGPELDLAPAGMGIDEAR